MSFDFFAGGLQHLNQVIILNRLIVKNFLVNRHQNIPQPREVRRVEEEVNSEGFIVVGIMVKNALNYLCLK